MLAVAVTVIEASLILSMVIVVGVCLLVAFGDGPYGAASIDVHGAGVYPDSATGRRRT